MWHYVVLVGLTNPFDILLSLDLVDTQPQNSDQIMPNGGYYICVR